MTKSPTMGLFISSKYFAYSENFYKEVSQFLTIDEDRSWAGRMKPEFIIRTGWLLQEQIQELVGADTVYFLNAEPKLGHAFLNQYDFESKTFRNEPGELEPLKKIYVLTSFELSSRKHRSVYIRSNRMLTEYIPVMVLSLHMQVIDLEKPDESIFTEVCFDAMNSKVAQNYFDLYASRSKVGKLLSQAFSQWWEQMLTGIPSNCTKQ